MTFSFFFCTEFTEEYPNKPPTVRFISRMFHPNVYADGGICLDILQNRWSPTYDVSAILTSIQSLLDEPNPNSPANSEAAQLYEENRREYEKRVAFIVENSWVHFTIDQVWLQNQLCWKHVLRDMLQCGLHIRNAAFFVKLVA